MEWTVNNQASSFEEIVRLFRRSMPRPIGVLVVGLERAAGDLKKSAVDALRDNLQGLRQTHYLMTLPSTTDLARSMGCKSDIIFVTLDSRQSASHEFRHKLVHNFDEANVKTTVVLYAKKRKKRSFFHLPSLRRKSSDKRKQIQIAKEMEANTPTQDGIDYLITVKASN